MSSSHLGRLLTSQEVEQMLGVGRGWCAKDRISGARIPFVKIGSACRYRPSDVQVFIDASVRRSTSDQDEPQAA
jgi:predicted DNA-binding transcriptional regulator AlpA